MKCAKGIFFANASAPYLINVKICISFITLKFNHDSTIGFFLNYPNVKWLKSIKLKLENGTKIFLYFLDGMLK